eukprot:68951_1
MAEEKQNCQNKNGFIEWKVNSDLMLQFKNAKHKQRFYSPQFKTVDGGIWRILFYPRGNKSSSQFSIYVQCVKLSAKKRRIGVNYSFNILELDWCDYNVHIFDNDG